MIICFYIEVADKAEQVKVEHAMAAPFIDAGKVSDLSLEEFELRRMGASGVDVEELAKAAFFACFGRNPDYSIINERITMDNLHNALRGHIRCFKHPQAEIRVRPKHRDHWPNKYACTECDKESAGDLRKALEYGFRLVADRKGEGDYSPAKFLQMAEDALRGESLQAWGTFAVSYEFLHKLWQALGSVPQGVNELCSGVYEQSRDAYQMLEDLFNGDRRHIAQPAVPEEEK